MKLITNVFFSLLLAFSASDVVAQVDSVVVDSAATEKRAKIAVLAPLYLDSVFVNGEYKFDKSFPRFLQPGIDFYQGVQYAIDSLKKEGVELDVNIYDTRAAGNSLKSIFDSPDFAGTDLVLAHVNMKDAQWLAYTAKSKNIPFVNVNFPNEAGVTDNPQYIILNSTLFTHCEGIYKFMQKNYALSPIVVFRKKGAQEDRLTAYLKDVEKNTSSVPLKMKYVTLADNFTPQDVSAQLDANKTTVVLGASLDVNFATRLAQQLTALNASDRANILVGMPNWDAINFTGTLYKGLEIMYSTPFNIAPSDSAAARLSRNYYSTFYFNPGEMIYRGFETVYQFGHMLNEESPTPFQQQIQKDTYKLFYDFNIQPVVNKKTNKIDYYENKKLFFVKKVDGVIKTVY
ncbi:MAG: hypothetical protein EOO02_07035 [Chitinophagaceae bacterium]|nr:MAG: hypothetical protein EOO02_07035 [Chitinophagaceae bacterium]